MGQNQNEIQQARALCVQLLNQTLQQRSYSTILLDSALQQTRLKNAGKRFCSVLYYGVLERLLTLDYIIGRYSKKSVEKLDLTVCNILRCGICQLLCFDTPAHVVVAESVSLTRTMRFSSASGFVNAVLRSFLRDDCKFPLPRDLDRSRSLQYSAPVWMVQKLTREYGAEAADSLLESSLVHPPVTVRRNPLRCTEQEFLTAMERWEPCQTLLPCCYTLNASAGDLTETDAFRNGCFHVQDLASQLCCQALGVQRGETVYDLCAAPGGKSFTLAELLEGTGKIHAFDLHAHRVQLICEGAERLGLSNLDARQRDAVQGTSLPEADRVLCDVPCSGYGVMRRKPEVKYKPERGADALPALQLQILERGAACVRPGGTLVYSTCTLSRAENDEVVAAFLKTHPDFEGIPFLEELGAPFGGPCVTLVPRDFGSDGFFIAKLRRRAAD